MRKNIKETSGATLLPELDLSVIKRRLLQKDGWDEVMARQAEQEYRQFLHLIKTNPGKALVPTEKIDEFWHLHILDTIKYAKDCEAIFGYFLHHDPNLEKGSRELNQLFHETESLHSEAFGRRTAEASACTGNGGACAGRCRTWSPQVPSICGTGDGRKCRAAFD